MKSTRSGIWLLSLLAAATWPTTSSGEQTMKAEELTRMKEEVTQRLQRHYVRHKGAQEPHGIPFVARMRSFFAAAGRHAADREALVNWLAARMILSESDQHALIQAISTADIEPQEVKAVHASSLALQQQMTKVEDAATAIDIGRKLNGLEDEAEALYAAQSNAFSPKCPAMGGDRSTSTFTVRSFRACPTAALTTPGCTAKWLHCFHRSRSSKLTAWAPLS
jgi:hypothetical protein